MKSQFLIAAHFFYSRVFKKHCVWFVTKNRSTLSPRPGVNSISSLSVGNFRRSRNKATPNEASAYSVEPKNEVYTNASVFPDSRKPIELYSTSRNYRPWRIRFRRKCQLPTFSTLSNSPTEFDFAAAKVFDQVYGFKTLNGVQNLENRNLSNLAKPMRWSSKAYQQTPQRGESIRYTGYGENYMCSIGQLCLDQLVFSKQLGLYSTGRDFAIAFDRGETQGTFDGIKNTTVLGGFEESNIGKLSTKWLGLYSTNRKHRPWQRLTPSSSTESKQPPARVLATPPSLLPNLVQRRETQAHRSKTLKALNSDSMKLVSSAYSTIGFLNKLNRGCEALPSPQSGVRYAKQHLATSSNDLVAKGFPVSRALGFANDSVEIKPPDLAPAIFDKVEGLVIRQSQISPSTSSPALLAEFDEIENAEPTPNFARSTGRLDQRNNMSELQNISKIYTKKNILRFFFSYIDAALLIQEIKKSFFFIFILLRPRDSTDFLFSESRVKLEAASIRTSSLALDLGSATQSGMTLPKVDSVVGDIRLRRMTNGISTKSKGRTPQSEESGSNTPKGFHLFGSRFLRKSNDPIKNGRYFRLLESAWSSLGFTALTRSILTLPQKAFRNLQKYINFNDIKHIRGFAMHSLFIGYVFLFGIFYTFVFIHIFKLRSQYINSTTQPNFGSVAGDIPQTVRRSQDKSKTPFELDAGSESRMTKRSSTSGLRSVHVSFGSAALSNPGERGIRQNLSTRHIGSLGSPFAFDKSFGEAYFDFVRGHETPFDKVEILATPSTSSNTVSVGSFDEVDGKASRPLTKSKTTTGSALDSTKSSAELAPSRIESQLNMSGETASETGQKINFLSTESLGSASIDFATAYPKTLQISYEILRLGHYSGKIFIIWSFLKIWKGIRPSDTYRNETRIQPRILFPSKNKKRFKDIQGIEKFAPILKTLVESLRYYKQGRPALAHSTESFGNLSWLRRRTLRIRQSRRGGELLRRNNEGPLATLAYRLRCCFANVLSTKSNETTPTTSSKAFVNWRSTGSRASLWVQPKGYVFVGNPGTGKTLLAQAVAGEAQVNLICLSASEIQKQIDIGTRVGALRIRNLFETAKKNTPCILFLDEIDSIGGSRSAYQASLNEVDYDFNVGSTVARPDTFGLYPFPAPSTKSTAEPSVFDKVESSAERGSPGGFDLSKGASRPLTKSNQNSTKLKTTDVFDEVGYSTVSNGKLRSVGLRSRKLLENTLDPDSTKSYSPQSGVGGKADAEPTGGVLATPPNLVPNHVQRRGIKAYLQLGIYTRESQLCTAEAQVDQFQSLENQSQITLSKKMFGHSCNSSVISHVAIESNSELMLMTGTIPKTFFKRKVLLSSSVSSNLHSTKPDTALGEPRVELGRFRLRRIRYSTKSNPRATSSNDLVAKGPLKNEVLQGASGPLISGADQVFSTSLNPVQLVRQDKSKTPFEFGAASSSTSSLAKFTADSESRNLGYSTLSAPLKRYSTPSNSLSGGFISTESKHEYALYSTNPKIYSTGFFPIKLFATLSPIQQLTPSSGVGDCLGASPTISSIELSTSSETTQSYSASSFWHSFASSSANSPNNIRSGYVYSTGPENKLNGVHRFSWAPFDSVEIKPPDKAAQSMDTTVLTEFLIQMDNFSIKDGLIVIGTTNFLSNLDGALVRSGRFDRILGLQRPNKKTRISLLQFYTAKSKLKTNPGVPWDKLADKTRGFSAADLSQSVNESSLFILAEAMAKPHSMRGFGFAGLASKLENFLNFVQMLNFAQFFSTESKAAQLKSLWYSISLKKESTTGFAVKPGLDKLNRVQRLSLAKPTLDSFDEVVGDIRLRRMTSVEPTFSPSSNSIGNFRLRRNKAIASDSVLAMPYHSAELRKLPAKVKKDHCLSWFWRNFIQPSRFLKPKTTVHTFESLVKGIEKISVREKFVKNQ